MSSLPLDSDQVPNVHTNNKPATLSPPPPTTQSPPPNSVWVVRPNGTSGRVVAVAAETSPSTTSTPTPMPTPRDSLTTSISSIPSTSSTSSTNQSRIPRSLAVSDMTADQSHAALYSNSIDQRASPTRLERPKIEDVNKRWDEMMKSTTPVPQPPTPPFGHLTPSGSATKNHHLVMTAPSSATLVNGSDSRGSGSGSSLKFGDPSLSLALESPIPPTSAPIESSKKDALRKQKKSISFSDKVMYRSLSSIDMEDQQLASYELQQQQALMAISDLWSDEEEEFGACVGGYEDETLYSEDGAGRDWPRNDEFEDMVDGTNIMSLPLDDDDDLIPPPPPRPQRTSPPQNDSPTIPVVVSPNAISKSTFNASPVHRFLRTQNMSPITPVPSLRPSPPQTQKVSPTGSSRCSPPSKHESSNTTLLPQTIINNQIINLEIPSDIHDLFVPPPLQEPFEKPKSSSPPKGTTPPSPPNHQQPPSRASSKPPQSTSSPLLTKDSPLLTSKDLGLSPILLRQNGSAASQTHLSRSSLFKNLDDKVMWDDVITSSPAATLASSSPWIKRSSATLTQGNDLQPPKLELKSVDDTLVDTPPPTGISASELVEGGDVKLRTKKETMSSDSLVLEEEEIVLENTKADGVVSSAAFFIPLETELKVSGGGGKKDTVKEQELASYPPSEINIDEDTESVGKPASIAHAEPVVVVVAPQQTSPKALSTPRTSTSDAWIKEKNGVIAANISDSFLIGKESPRHTAGSGKSGKKSNSGRVKEEVGDKEEKVPIVVVKMSAESPTSPRKASGSPSKIRHQKPKAFPPDTYSPSTPRDSAVTLVNRDSMVSLKRDSQAQPSFGERVMVNRALLPDNGPFGELGMKEEIYPQASHRMSLTQRGYVPMPTSKVSYSNSTQYVTKFGSPMPDLVRQYNQNSPSSSLRSSTSTYTSSHSSQSLRSHQPYQSQSHLYTNRNIHKWAATSSTPSSLQYQTSPLSMDPQITPTPPPTSHSPRRSSKSSKTAKQSTSIRSDGSTSSKTRPFRNFITAPPNSVNSSRATTPLAPPERTHYRRISFGSTTSSLRSSVRAAGGGGIRGSNGSGVFCDENSGGAGTTTPTDTTTGLKLNGRVHSFESSVSEPEKRSSTATNVYFPTLQGILKNKRRNRRVGVEPPPPSRGSVCMGVGEEEVVKVEELVELGLVDDGIEIVEGKRSYPSLPLQENTFGVWKTEKKVGGARRVHKRRRMKSVVRGWFVNIWSRIVHLFRRRN